MKNKQGITIAALIVAIIGLSIGFAAFSNTLQISSSASVNPSDANFIVQFSKVSNADQTGSSYQIVPDSETYGDRATINSSNKKLLEGVHAKFTAPNQSVTYTLYVRNTGQYVAYLNELVFANATNATSGETYKHCYAATTDSNNQAIASENQATPSLVTQACNGINIKVTIGTADDVTPSTTGDKAHLNYQTIAVGSSLEASVTISYDSGSAYVDGPMEVEFGNIEINATSAVNPSLVVVPQQQGGGQQEEPQQVTADDLAPVGELTLNEDDEYLIAQYTSSNTIMYRESNGIKHIVASISNPSFDLYWFIDATDAAAFSSMMHADIDPNKWYYYDDETWFVYEQQFPLSRSDFENGTIHDSDYLNRVLATFPSGE